MIRCIASLLLFAAFVVALLASSAAASIIEGDFTGTYGDTVSFSASTKPNGTPGDDLNVDTTGDHFIGEGFFGVGSVLGATDPNPTFFLSSGDLDYVVAFPAPGTYTIKLFENIEGFNVVTMLDETTAQITDSALITLEAVIPEPSTLILAAVGLVGLAAFGWRRRKR